MTRPQLTPEQIRIAELENEVSQLKDRLKAAIWRKELIAKENIFLMECRHPDPYVELLVTSGL